MVICIGGFWTTQLSSHPVFSYIRLDFDLLSWLEGTDVLFSHPVNAVLPADTITEASIYSE